MNTDPNLRSDPISESVDELASYISHKEKYSFRSDDEDSDEDIRPFKGFAKPLSKYKSTNINNIWSEKTNRLLHLIGEHVDEAIQTGFDDSIAKYKGKSHFMVRFLEYEMNTISTVDKHHRFQSNVDTVQQIVV